MPDVAQPSPAASSGTVPVPDPVQSTPESCGETPQELAAGTAALQKEPREKVLRVRLKTLAAVLGLVASQTLAVSAVSLPLHWHWSNPQPHGGNVVDMSYSSSLFLAVQVAERGQIYTSDDLDTWLPRESNTTNALRAVTFFGSRILITGENGCVIYADDPAAFENGTLLDGTTTDWLEAVTTSFTLAVAVGDNGAVYTSTNGVSWKRQNSGTSNWLRGVAYGSSVFLGVGEQGTVISSTDGTNWVNKSSGTTTDLNRVSFSNGQFTVVGDEGLTLYSTNAGLNWFNDSSGATNALQDATTSNNALLLVGDHEVRLKGGGIWSNEIAQTNGPPDWTYYCGFGRPDFFLIAGQSGMQSEGYPAGDSSFYWLSPYNSVRTWLWDVHYQAGLYVTVGDFGTIMTSGNSVDWALELTPGQMTNTTFLGVGGDTNLLLAVGSGGSIIVSPNTLTNIVITNSSGTILTQTVSTIGVIWHTINQQPTTNDLQGIAVLGTNLYVLTGAKGTVLTSPDGLFWTPRTSPTTKLLTSVTAWPGGLVATGDKGAIITSPDGITWTLRTSGTVNWLYRVRYLNGFLIAVGQNGALLTSTNGINWTPRATGTTLWLNDVSFIQDTYFIIGNSGTVLTSTNLTSWTDQGTLTKKALYAAATDFQQLVVVGVEGAILRSQVVPNLTPITILDYARVMAPNFTQNLFLFGGVVGQQFTLDRCPEPGSSNWITGPVLELLRGDGTLFYLETVYGTNIPPQEYYRATLVPVAEPRSE